MSNYNIDRRKIFPIIINGQTYYNESDLKAFVLPVCDRYGHSINLCTLLKRAKKCYAAADFGQFVRDFCSRNEVEVPVFSEANKVMTISEATRFLLNTGAEDSFIPSTKLDVMVFSQYLKASQGDTKAAELLSKWGYPSINETTESSKPELFEI